MLSFPVKRRRKHKSPIKWQPPAPQPPAPPALVLESAVYIAGSRVLLTFDRDIDASAFDAAAIFINDGDNDQRFEPDGSVPSVVGPLIVIMLAIGGLLILAKGSAVAPFIYTLF